MGTCSAAISAACHNPEGKRECLEKLHWGVVLEPVGDTPGHCCLTSQSVKPPVVGAQIHRIKGGVKSRGDSLFFFIEEEE